MDGNQVGRVLVTAVQGAGSALLKVWGAVEMRFELEAVGEAARFGVKPKCMLFVKEVTAVQRGEGRFMTSEDLFV